MPADVTYELNLEPAEDGEGWTAMIYRSVRAGVCGPFSGTVPVPSEGEMFTPARVLAERALLALGQVREFEVGEIEVYGRYGAIALRVMLTERPITQQVPVFDDEGALRWVEVPMRRG